MRWQDYFELVVVSKYTYGGYHTIGGDPDLHNHNPIVYKIIDKETGDMLNIAAAPKYTAEYYAQKQLDLLIEKVEKLLLTNE